MKRLTETAMFRQLSTEGIFNSAETALKTMYDDFARAVMDICTSKQTEVSAYFTLHYTRLEFDQLNTKGTGEKYCIQHLPA